MNYIFIIFYFINICNLILILIYIKNKKNFIHNFLKHKEIFILLNLLL